jgi:trans-aconitate 2-methyltransferase
MWDAREYDIVADVQERWGRKLIERNQWRGDEVVLDAGCGSGRLFPHLLEKIPRGRLYGADADGRMVQQARERAQGIASKPAVVVLQCDLSRIDLAVIKSAEANSTNGPQASVSGFDVVISNAVFHWIADKLALFSHLSALLKTEGRLTAQFGGLKNLQRARSAAYRAARETDLLAALHVASEKTIYLPAEDTRDQLRVCGFRNVRVWEHEEQTVFPDRESFLRFCAAVIFTPLRPLVPESSWQPFLNEFAAQIYGLFGEWKLDYVRQNIEAQK